MKINWHQQLVQYKKTNLKDIYNLTLST